MGSLRKNPGRGGGTWGGRLDKVKTRDTGRGFGRGTAKPAKPLRPFGKGV